MAKHKPDKGQLIEAALLTARLSGCCCEKPRVHLREMRTGVYFADVKHDRWCRVIGGTGQA